MPTCEHGVRWDRRRYASSKLACAECAGGLAIRPRQVPTPPPAFNWDVDHDLWSSAFWKRVRSVGIERRRAEVQALLDRDTPPPIIPEIDNLPPGELTTKQREALVLWKSYAMTYGEVAAHLVISKNAAVKRIRAGMRRVHSYWGSWNPRRRRVALLGVRDG